MSQDFRDFFLALQEHGVEFRVIGGVAYASTRPTC
jgi:hypothetical protein